MQHDCAITVSLKRAQVSVFHQAAKLGITQKIIHFDTGLSLSVIGQYARGETAMGLPALLKLIGVIPDNLLSLLLPDGRLIVRAPEELNYDEAAEMFSDFVATKLAFHHPESEAGREIGPTEDKVLRVKFAAATTTSA